eukprot:CAMPEP_0181113566 /NCGR_PEP_ID=MMETSP1071-20121207/20416_1 /TAXON_ID=35127 /ORGANISM="Thalassiosira sp., Strain NH16" /LENGTH=879 /DNA_ID=CAMNT_0023197613 /DNA_START=119 /DNA_END=2758 /DNA_ORIENTATION=-
MAREDREVRRGAQGDNNPGGDREHNNDNDAAGSNNHGGSRNSNTRRRRRRRPRAEAASDGGYVEGGNDNNSNNNSNSNDQSYATTNDLADNDISTARDRALAELQLLCDAASESSPPSWEAIRRWLRNHSADDARSAAERRGDYETTPLHLACRNCPPRDIVRMLLAASPRTVEWTDSFGWLPLHYACANEASEEVLVMLAEIYPESGVCVDKRRRTPLHFALGHTERPAKVATVVLLSGTGAALMADENGMLPLHYACAYGATEQALRELTDEHIQTIVATDNRGRTPLHFAFGNADRPASPGVVDLLLSQNPSAVDSVDLEGNLPIHLLATRAQALKDHEKDKRANCRRCFGLYLDARPRATADLLTALQSLPEWLRDYAALSPVVQNMLNAKISQRFPTAILLMDFVFYCIVIGFFQEAVTSSLAARASDGGEMDKTLLIPLYLAVLYFSVREIVQALSLASLGLFNTWYSDLENFLDMAYIVLILFWSIIMNVNGLTIDAFRTGAAISMSVYWFMILIFLRSIVVGFAVFMGGVTYVMKRLAVFVLSLIIILVMFSQIFYTLFLQTEGCGAGTNSGDYTDFPVYSYSCNYTNEAIGGEVPDCTLESVQCQPENSEPFCNFWTSFLKIFTMLLGEVDESYFSEQNLEYSYRLATTMFALFMFTCVIVLANVLIAIVTDSYSVIQNERAALEFWSNRLDFVAEMDVIYNSFSRRGRGEAPFENDENNSNTMEELWKKFMYLFDDDVVEHGGVMSVEFIVYNILRVFALLVVIPLWIIVGAISMGMLWPPQVREKLLTNKIARRTEKTSAERTRLNQVSKLKEDVTSLQKEVKGDMERGRNEVHLLKVALDSTKTEIHAEMNNVKEIVTELFELLSAP